MAGLPMAPVFKNATAESSVLSSTINDGADVPYFCHTVMVPHSLQQILSATGHQLTAAADLLLARGDERVVVLSLTGWNCLSEPLGLQ